MNRKLNGWKDRRAYRTSVYVIHDRTIDRIDRVIRMCTRKKIRKKQVRKSSFTSCWVLYISHYNTQHTLFARKCFCSIPAFQTYIFRRKILWTGTTKLVLECLVIDWTIFYFNPKAKTFFPWTKTLLLLNRVYQELWGLINCSTVPRLSKYLSFVIEWMERVS